MTLNLCSGCANFQVDAGDVVASWAHWHLLVNWSQNYLGKVMLVLHRHETDVTNLTAAEQSELWVLLGRIKVALVESFQPDHFNHVFLMNQDAHVHMHIVPRYATPRQFAGLTFDDGRLGEHYALDSRIVPLEIRQQIAQLLRTHGLGDAS